jgi:hypothetical protein
LQGVSDSDSGGDAPTSVQGYCVRNDLGSSSSVLDGLLFASNRTDAMSTDFDVDIFEFLNDENLSFIVGSNDDVLTTSDSHLSASYATLTTFNDAFSPTFSDQISPSTW